MAYSTARQAQARQAGNHIDFDTLECYVLAKETAMTAQRSPVQETAGQAIHQLAIRHGISRRRSKLDDFGDAVTRLAGDEVHLDAAEWLPVELGRAEVLTGADNTLLHHRYLRERNA